MRIVHAVASDRFAGVERHIARLARTQRAHGHDVAVIGGEPTAMASTFGDVYVLHRPARKVTDVVRQLRALAPGADVVHVHMTAAEVAAAVAGATAPRFPPVVATRHFAARRGSGWLGGLTRFVARRPITAQIAVSKYVAEHIDGQSSVIYPGVDPVPSGDAERENVVVMVQRLEAEKRTDLGVRAFAASGLAGRGWRLDILGDGARRSELEALASELGIADQVRFLGTRSDVEKHMRRAAILLAPCPIEGLGLSVLEAVASGLPVVAADAGGHVELLSGLDPAGLYPPQEWRQAGNQLAMLAGDPDRRRRYGQAARARQRDRFTPGQQAAATDAVYRDVTDKAVAADLQDLVIVSLEAWDDLWRRNQYLVTELAKADPGLRVLFVEPPADPLHQLSRGVAARAGRGLRLAPPVEGLSSDWLYLYQPTKLLPRRIDPYADKRLADAVRRAARQAGMRRPVLWINDPAAARLLTDTGWPTLYDITDDWLAAERPAAEHTRLVRNEMLLRARAGAVVVCSDHLAGTKGTNRDVDLITNAVDVERYRLPKQRPSDLPSGPIALYLGTVHPDRFDVDLLLATAVGLEGEATVVIVGPVVDLTEAQHQAMRQAGVVSLGPRPWSQVPAYLQHAAVLLVPHLVNEFTDSLDPIKLYEYRAVGVSVVSTPVAGFRDSNDPRVASVTAEHFPAAVRAALSDTGTHPAADDLPTWEGQARLMGQVITRVQHEPIPN